MKCDGDWPALLAYDTEQLAHETDPERMVSLASDQYRAATHLGRQDIVRSASALLSQYAVGVIEVLQQEMEGAEPVRSD